MNYVVKTQQYEGPFDILLDLIESQKMDITRISLAVIADQYIEYIQNRDQISLTYLADFLSIAAKLVLIKSKALLPILRFDEEEESDMEELERQLAALKAVKDVIPEFGKLFQNPKSQFARKGMWGISPQFTPPSEILLQDIRDAFLVSLNSIPQLDKLEEKVITDIISLEKRIVYVQNMVAIRAKVAFSEVIKNTDNPSEVIVSFLALLELVKQKIIFASQKDVFQEIELTSLEYIEENEEKIK